MPADGPFLPAVPRCGPGGNTMPTQFMGPSLGSISEYIKNLVAPSTWAGYQLAWFLWLSFLNSIQEPTGSFSEGLILLFLDYLFIKKYSMSYVQKTLSGI